PGYVLRRPDANLGELARLQTFPRRIEASRVLLPAGISGQRCQWRVGARLDAGKEASIVVSTAVGGRTGQNCKDKKARNESSQYGPSELFVHCVARCYVARDGVRR